MKGEADRNSDAAASKENSSNKEVESSASAAAQNANAPARARQPFTQLTQFESDMAIAKALQEQERAYMLLRTGYGYGNNVIVGDEEDEDESDGDEEEFDRTNTPAVDGSQFENDEAFARALQEAEDRETTARMMALAGIHDLEEGHEDEDEVGGDEEEEREEEEDEEEDDDDEDEDEEDESDESQDMWQDVDPDNMTYEELIALGEVVGVESKGLTPQAIAELPVSSFKHEEGSVSSESEQCVICRVDYEEEDMVLTLPCKHKYHSECIQQWLQINKVCPVCSAAVSTV